jgi:hypothetical protein
MFAGPFFPCVFSAIADGLLFLAGCVCFQLIVAPTPNFCESGNSCEAFGVSRPAFARGIFLFSASLRWRNNATVFSFGQQLFLP